MIRTGYSLLIAGCAAACATVPPPAASTPTERAAPTAGMAEPAPVEAELEPAVASSTSRAGQDSTPTQAPAPTARETCYRISRQEDFWAKTPELLCTQSQGNQEYILTMRTGLTGDREVALFFLHLLERAKCIDCNRDVFGLANPSNSTFNELQIRFHGERDLANGRESGTVSVGRTSFFYQLAGSSR